MNKSTNEPLTAPISEIFASLQGEGIYAGQPQIFIRFTGCNLKCDYCDTLTAKTAVDSSQMTVDKVIKKVMSLKSTVNRQPSTVSITGTAKTAVDSSRMTVDKVIKKVMSLKSTVNRQPSTVSITGGEPLLYADFLSRLLPELKKLKLKIYLETNGTLPQSYKIISKYVDVVAMDIKLPSSCGESFWKKHIEFLRISKGRFS